MDITRSFDYQNEQKFHELGERLSPKTQGEYNDLLFGGDFHIVAPTMSQVSIERTKSSRKMKKENSNLIPKVPFNA
ncbi:hypothetical protein Syun_016655 [Stephania yunnanensis]|uniref:Uncharacterized protein n=1 Tax=Stephania yunnanensis TaxID=152371 RepID=A0AAP0J5L6_9MAGN